MMRTLIETTFPTLAIIALPMMFYMGITFGTDISQTNESSTNPSIETVFEFADEPYIEDIPFDTKSIVEKSKNQTSVTPETETLVDVLLTPGI